MEALNSTKNRRPAKAARPASFLRSSWRKPEMDVASRQATHGASQSSKAAASGWIGSALEYYDFFIYATAASLVFPQIFFPSDNPTTAIVASLATYGVGYVARPIGAFVLGHWGDTHGRKTVLIVCMFLIIAGYVIRRNVDETPAFAEESEHGEVPKAPIIQAFKLSWRDMLRVVCMALMNVIS